MEGLDVATELLDFASNRTSSLELRIRATECISGLTGTDDGRRFLLTNFNAKLSELLSDLLTDKCTELNIKGLNAIVNLSADEYACDMLTTESILSILFKIIATLTSETLHQAECASMALSNIAHWENGAVKIMTYLKQQENHSLLFNMVDTFFKTTDGIHHFGSFLANLTQVNEARRFFLDQEKMIFQKLLSFISFKGSKVRQHGIVSAIKNCCFETESHLWMLSEKVDILPILLLPLAGPEEFDDEDMEKLPLDLQYLGSDKERDPDPVIRKMLAEAVNQLCATKAGRKIIEGFNTYIILRELHKWETDDLCIVAIENLVSVLISDEPGVDLNEVKIPEELEDKMNKIAVTQ